MEIERLYCTPGGGAFLPTAKAGGFRRRVGSVTGQRGFWSWPGAGKWLLVVLGLAGAGPVWGQSEAPVVRPVWVRAEQAPALLEQARQGVWVQVPRQEWDRLLARVQGPPLPAPAPRLLKARYWAELVGALGNEAGKREALVPALVGRGDWTIVPPGPGPAWLSLAGLHLAVQQVKVEGAPALLGVWPGRGLGLWLEKSGPQTVTFDWSLRGAPGVGEMAFDIQVPACPQNLLEITLPAEYLLTIPHQTALLRGPEFAGPPDRRLWRLYFAGRSQLSLVLRPGKGPGALTPLLLYSVTSRQQLQPGRLSAEFKVQVEVVHGPVPQLVFDLDPQLRVQEVTCPGLPLQNWELIYPKKDQKNLQPQLVVSWAEPVRGQLPPLRLLAEAPVTPEGSWQSPGIWLQGAVFRGEVLELRLPGDWDLSDWSAGGFRLLASQRTEEGQRLLRLAAEAGASAALARPRARSQPAPAVVALRQETLWDLDPAGWRLTADLHCTVQRGRLFQLALELPAGGYKHWQVEKVEEIPPGRLRGWATAIAGQTATLLLDWMPALTAGQKARVRVVLRTAPPAGAAEWELPFPQLLPRTTGPLSGALTIRLSPHYQLLHVAALPPAPPPTTASTTTGQNIQIYYEYRDKPIQGRLRFRPRTPRFQAQCSNEVVLTARRAHLQCQLQLTPLVGALREVTLYLTAPPPAHWQVEAAPGEETPQLEPWPVGAVLPRLLLLGETGRPLATLGTLAAQPAGSYWRLRWSTPLTQNRTVTLTAFWPQAAEPIPGGEERWTVPLLTAPAAEQLTGEVQVHLRGATLVALQAHGLRESGGLRLSASKPAPLPPWPPSHAEVERHFTFHLPGSCSLPELYLRSRPAPAPAFSPESCEGAELCTTVYPDGRLVHVFRGQLRHWRSRTFPIRLPAGAHLLSAQVAGRWLSGLAAEEGPEGPVLPLPVRRDSDIQSFEISYMTFSSTSFWQPWRRLAAPWPEVPVPIRDARPRWRLPPGWALLAASWQRVPAEMASAAEDLAWLRRLWFLGDAGLRALGPPLASETPVARWLPLLADAEIALRQQLRPGQSLSLGQLLERLLRQHLQDRVPLVLDRLALEEAGLGPETLLPTESAEQPLWQRLGLVLLPTPRAVVLTTASASRRWPQGEAATWSEEGLAALEEAATAGQDASGRFQDLAHWQVTARPGASPVPDARAEVAADWTLWEPLAGTAPPAELWIISQPFCNTVGLTLAAVLGLAGGLLGSRWGARGRLRLVLVWLGLGGLAWVWAPAACRFALFWPLAAGGLLAGGWYLCPPPERISRTDSSGGSSSPAPAQAPVTGGSSRRRTNSMLFLLISLMGLGVGTTAWRLAGAAQPPGEPDRTAEPSAETVYLLPGPPQTVLVRPAFLRRLEAQPQPAAPSSQAIFLSAHYQGRVQEHQADCQADFLLYCPAERTQIVLPLQGVELKEGSLLDGAPAYPLPAEGQGYVLPVAGRAGKLVQLRVPFRVPVQATGEAREVRFGVPAAAQASLTWLLPPGARRPQVATALGRQEMAAGNQLHADLGLADLGQPAGASAVQLRWQQPGPTRPTGGIRLREYYFWDLRPGLPDDRQPLPATPALTAVLQYALGGNAISHLLLDLPEDLEVRSLEATPALPLTALSHRLKSWRLQPAGKGKRRLFLEWSGPVAGDIQLTLGLVPRQALGAGPLSLVLPVPVFPPVLYEKSPAGLLAYRTAGREVVDRPQHLGAINIPAAQFLKEWEELGLRTFAPGEETKAALRAYRFRRTRPEAALEVVPVPGRGAGAWQLAWHFTPTHADWQASARLPAGHAATFLEWEVPPEVTLFRVSGKEVQHWSRQGNRLFLWLRPAAGPVSVELAGWLASLPSRRFSLPAVRWLTPLPGTADLTLTAAPGLTLDVDHLHNLLPLAQEGPPTFTLAHPGQPYALQVQIQPVPAEAQAQVLTLLQAQEGWLHFTTHLRLSRTAPRLQPVQLHLQQPPGTLLRVERPADVHLEESPRQSQTWQARLQLPPGTTPYFEIKIHGKCQIWEGTPLLAPRLALQGVQLQGHWLALVGKELQVQRQQGLAPQSAAAQELAAWPLAAHLVRQQGQVWKITGESWQLLLHLQAAPAPSPVRLFLAEESLFPAGAAGWRHESRFLVTASAPIELPLRLPEGARGLAATVDGRPVPCPSGPLLLLPLPPQAGWHTVCVWWSVEPGRELFSRPRLEHAGLDKNNNYPLLWHIYRPPGYHLRSLPAVVEEAFPAEVEAHRAAACLSLFAKEGKALAAVGEAARWEQLLQQARGHLRRAEIERLTELAAARLRQDFSAAERLLALGERLDQLHQQLEALRRQPTKPAPPVSASPPGAADSPSELSSPVWEPVGRPCHWQARATQPPRCFLEAATALSQRRRLLASELLLGFLLAIWILSHLGRLVQHVRSFWPEQLLLLALAGGYALGPSLVEYLLLLVAGLSRLVLLGRWFWWRWSSRTPPAPVSTTAS
jgi:hypothetical protein